MKLHVECKKLHMEEASICNCGGNINAAVSDPIIKLNVSDFVS